MAFIAFQGRKKTVGIYRLTGPTTVGRSLDSDVFVPDIYLSRHHCRFERHEGCWRVVDMESSNGLWVGTQRVQVHILKPGDTIELGTIAILFNEGDPEQESNPAPFGMGFGVADLMDTICTEGVRPSSFSKKQTARKKQWLTQMRARVEHAYEDDIALPEQHQEPWQQEEWAELDLEIQLVDAQEQITDWQPPIFNPPRQLVQAQAQVQSQANSHIADQEDYDLISPASITKSLGRRVHDSIDEEVERRLAEKIPAIASAPSSSLFTRLTSWLPFGRKPKMSMKNMDGVEFIPYTWRDKLVDGVKDLAGRGMDFAKLNPALAAVGVLGLAVAIGAVARYAPVGKRGPHYYIPPKTEVAVVAKP